MRVQNFTDPFNAFADLSILPTDSVTPPLQDNSLITRLVNERTVQAIDRTDDVIRHMDRAIPLNPGSDDGGILVFIPSN